MTSLIIHMPTSTARAPNVAQLKRDLPQAQVVDAVDGRDAAQVAQVRTHDGALHRPHYPFPMRPAEIGVFQSHRKCWQLIVDAGWEGALVVEDDLSLDTARFARALALLRQHATPDMFIRIPFKNREAPARVLATDGDMQLMLPKVIALNCTCQWVGRDAAQRLLLASPEIDRPVDTWLQMHWATGQPVHTLPNAGVSEIGGQIGGSTIQAKPAGSKLKREWQRLVYRMQVARRPQK